MNVPTLTITLYERDARFIVEALDALEAKWLHINKTTADEDEQAEYGMDAAVLDFTREKLQTAAVEAFGSGVMNFLHEPPLPPLPSNHKIDSIDGQEAKLGDLNQLPSGGFPG